MHAGDFLPAVFVLEVNAGADDVRQCTAQGLDARLYLVEDVDGLAVGILGADDFASTMRRRRAAHQDSIADADGAAVAGERLP